MKVRLSPAAWVVVAALLVVAGWVWVQATTTQGTAAEAAAGPGGDLPAQPEPDLAALRQRVVGLEASRTQLRSTLDPAATAAVAEVNALVRQRRCGEFVGAGAKGDVADAGPFADAAVAEVAARTPALAGLPGWDQRVDRGPLAPEVCVPPPPVAFLPPEMFAPRSATPQDDPPANPDLARRGPGLRRAPGGDGGVGRTPGGGGGRPRGAAAD